ncbi:MAG TPA: ATP-binding protein [Planctomycetaceae bacterium]|nr:ATP-binding protein [Planctomycetaceae bacterium]
MDRPFGTERLSPLRSQAGADARSSRLLAGLIGFCAVVFLVDLVVPIGAGSAIPYVLAAMAALWLPRRRQRMFIAALGTCLTVLGFFFPFPRGELFLIALQSRGLAMLAIWSTTYLGNLLVRRTDQLRDREARLRAILDAAVDAVFTTDREGTIESCNPAAEQMFAARATDLVGRNIDVILPRLDFGGDTEPETAFERFRDTPGVLQGRRLDGGRFPVDVTWSVVVSPEVVGSPAVVAIVREISDLVEAQDRAIQAERLAAIGQTIAALSHESRNELNTLRLTTELLRRVAHDPPQVLSLLDRLQHSQGRLLRLFEDVRGFAAGIVLEPVECCLARVWARAWDELAGRREGRDAVLHERVEAVDLTCLADEFRLEQVFRNLFENSLAACDDPMRIEIACAPAEMNGEPALAITVRDNGPGIPPDVQKRIFEPFFTTKTRGTGLGMPISRRIIEAHGGRMTVGECRSGAEFQITLPRQAPASCAAEPMVQAEESKVSEAMARSGGLPACH